MALLDDKKRARFFYRFLSRIYDSVNPLFWNEEMRDRAIEIAEIDETDRVVDVGCGTGFATLGLLKKTDKIIGLDQSQHQLREAGKKPEIEEIDTILGDAENTPFHDDLFDVVWSSGSIEYWPEPVETLRELRRITTPGGRILVVGPKKPGNRLIAGITDRIMLFYTENEAEEMFRNAGWVNIESTILGSSYISNCALITYAEKPKK